MNRFNVCASIDTRSSKHPYLFLTGAANSLFAHDGDWDKNHHYYVDKTGYWDEHDVHQKFIKYHGHHGYWDKKGDHKIFIKID